MSTCSFPGRQTNVSLLMQRLQLQQQKNSLQFFFLSNFISIPKARQLQPGGPTLASGGVDHGARPSTAQTSISRPAGGVVSGCSGCCACRAATITAQRSDFSRLSPPAPSAGSRDRAQVHEVVGDSCAPSGKMEKLNIPNVQKAADYLRKLSSSEGMLLATQAS